jgi:hypothetical protein
MPLAGTPLLREAFVSNPTTFSHFATLPSKNQSGTFSV